MKLVFFVLFWYHLVDGGWGSDYCSINDCSPRTFLVQMSSPSVSINGDVESLEKSVIDETELVNKCWKYSWKGPVNDNTNKSTSCDTSPDSETHPCFEPIVWTNGTNKDNQPDLADLQEKCKQGQTIQHKTCIPFCTKNDDVCVKMTYYNRDSEHTIQETVSFCGKGQIETDGNKAIKSGCYTQSNTEEGLDVEACFCDTDGCNGSISVLAQVNNLFIILLYCCLLLLLLSL